MVDVALNIGTILQVVLIGAIGAHLKAVRDLSSTVKILEFRLQNLEKNIASD